MSPLDKIRELIGGNRSVRRVADDLGLTSELILLVRMMFADGALKPEEMAAFSALCEQAFGLKRQDVPQVLEYLRDFGYETSAWNAAAMFREMSEEHRKSLLLHMLDIARSDSHLDVSEAELIRKTASVLGVSADLIAQWRKEAG